MGFKEDLRRTIKYWGIVWSKAKKDAWGRMKMKDVLFILRVLLVVGFFIFIISVFKIQPSSLDGFIAELSGDLRIQTFYVVLSFLIYIMVSVFNLIFMPPIIHEEKTKKLEEFIKKENESKLSIIFPATYNHKEIFIEGATPEQVIQYIKQDITGLWRINVNDEYEYHVNYEKTKFHIPDNGNYDLCGIYFHAVKWELEQRNGKLQCGKNEKVPDLFYISITSSGVGDNIKLKINFETHNDEAVGFYDVLYKSLAKSFTIVDIEKNPSELNLFVHQGSNFSESNDQDESVYYLTVDVVNFGNRKIIELDAHASQIIQWTDEHPDDRSIANSINLSNTSRLEWQDGSYQIDIKPGHQDNKLKIASLNLMKQEFDFVYEGKHRNSYHLKQNAIYKITIAFKGKLEGEFEYKFFRFETEFVSSPKNGIMDYLPGAASFPHFPEELRGKLRLPVKEGK